MSCGWFATASGAEQQDYVLIFDLFGRFVNQGVEMKEFFEVELFYRREKFRRCFLDFFQIQCSIDIPHLS